jgi:hypothetical protein
MPFIYPKRFLRPRDVLDPSEFNNDTKPVQELLDGELDRHNFDASSLKAGIKKHPDDADVHGSSDAALAEGAYFTSHYQSVEVPVCFSDVVFIDTAGSTPESSLGLSRKPPNFVKTDGVTFRNTDAFDGESATYPNYDGTKPSIIPNNESWDTVKNADLTDSMKITVTTGQAKLYINAFAQYVWQGFYEYKNPWRFEGLDADTTRYGWQPVHESELAQQEANVLNSYGPDDNWLAWSTPLSANAYLSGLEELLDEEFGFIASTIAASGTTVHDGNDDPTVFPKVFTASYSYSLNELTITADERASPQLGGYHHISRGFYPCNVQFALRVDGKIIDETITGKSYSFEESPHGIRVEDSNEVKSDIAGVLRESRFGQRSILEQMDYLGDGTSAVPGQKIRTSRASGCGPEVLPVRIGAVLPVEPGTHTIEIVARRLKRKRKQFEVGDFVGVFSRRLHAMVLPIDAVYQDLDPNTIPVQTKNLQSENLIEQREEFQKYESLKERLNSVRAQDIKRRSLPNTHLPSKVRFWKTVGWNPTYNVKAHHVTETTLASQGDSRFPGWRNSTYIDKRSFGTWKTGYTADAGGGIWLGAGWKMLTTTNSQGDLRIAETANLKLADNEELLIFADVEVRNLICLLPKHIRDLIDLSAKGLGGDAGITSDKALSNVLGYLMQNRYLDVFGMLAIGYRTGTNEYENWTIASKQAPAVINASSWVNRSSGFFVADNVKGAEVFTSDGGGIVGSEASVSAKYDRDRDLRGMFDEPSNLGITVPLFLRLTKDDFTTDAQAELTEVAVFGCTTFPSEWSDDEAEGSRLRGGNLNSDAGTDDIRPFYLPYYTTAGVEESGGGFGGLSDQVSHAWKSPVFGRRIIDGVKFNFGRGRLTVLKVVK